VQEAEADAVALIDQWDIGRGAADDGLVILFDLTPDRCHGQVQLYAGTSYADAHLSNAERQAIFEQDMLPALRDCDIDAALLAAMAAIDAASGTATGDQSGTHVSGQNVVDVYPMDLGAGPVAADDFKVLRGDDLVEFLLGMHPEPLDRLALDEFMAAMGQTPDEVTLVSGWHRFDDGDVNLMALQFPGAATTELADATVAYGRATMWYPEVETSVIAGKDVTIFHTEESLGRPNYLYVHGDIAWIFVTPESHVQAVLDHLPG
jgi:hypothetical protein